ncbi:MAG: DUF1330 domain-containing protein [Burkholderiaceae bacterium]
MALAYVIGQITVRDAQLWESYRSQVAATLTPFGGELVFRGTQAAAFAGENPHSNVVVIRFPNLAAASSWHASAAYQALIPLRLQAGDVVLTAYET